MRQSAWNKYEVALLLEGYIRIADGNANRKDVAKEISERLRSDNYHENITYRNINGITLQLGAIDYLMSDGAHGISHVSNLFKEIVKLYKEDCCAYQKLLYEAKQRFPDII